MKPCALILSIVVTLTGSPAWANDEVLLPTDVRRYIDLRVEELDAERDQISTTGPQLATIFGVLGVVGGTVALLAAPQATNDENAPVGAITAGLMLMTAGGASTVVGAILWGKRAKRRRTIDAERELLIKERNAITESLSRIELSAPFRDGTHFVTLGVRF